MRRANRRNECLVHQFLDSQRRAQDAASSTPSGASASASAASDVDSEHYKAHPSCTLRDQRIEHTDIAESKGHHDIVEPKHRHTSPPDDRCRAVLEAESQDSSEAGQADQQAWTNQMTKGMLELDEYDEVHSRMLTKKQLSDMAWGVRELSRRLSSMRIRFRAKNLFILTKVHDQDLIPKTRQLTKWLLNSDRDVKYTVYVQENLKGNKRFDASSLIDELVKGYVDSGEMDDKAARESVSKRLKYWKEDMCRTRPHTFDFVITLGGDGTVLYASWLFQRIVPPVLSFALGSLGFLTKFDFEEHDKILTSAFSKGVTVSLRLRFEGTVMRSQPRKNGKVDQSSDEEVGDEDARHRKRDLVEELIGEEREDEHTHRPDGTWEILNEIVVDRGPNPSE